jgi:hypothetical protein
MKNGKISYECPTLQASALSKVFTMRVSKENGKGIGRHDLAISTV